jgi:hypothetical protein
MVRGDIVDTGAEHKIFKENKEIETLFHLVRVTRINISKN